MGANRTPRTGQTGSKYGGTGKPSAGLADAATQKRASLSHFPVAAIVLAAGAGIRMGQLKQLLLYREKPFVRHAIEQAQAAGFDPVIVVVGAQAAAVRAAIAVQHVDIVENRQWAKGMGSSIGAGIRKLQADENEAAAVAILLADQPLVTAAHLSAMRQRLFESGPQVVAAEYNGTLGVPALFQRVLFRKLALLAPDAGAKHLLRDPDLHVLPFPLPEAARDIDTPDDYAGLEKQL